MRLGELLVQEGLITVQALESALRGQVLYGGRLGTNLVEMGFLGLDELARALAKVTGVPAALQKHFDQVDRSTLKLVSARLAERHQAVPLGMTRAGRHLVVAFIDPLQLSAIDEIGFAAGCPVTACVAPELRVLYHLEKLYGIGRKNRYLRIEGATSPTSLSERRRFVAPYPAESVTLAVEVPTPLDLPEPPPPPRAPPPAILPVRARPALSASDAVARMARAEARDQVGELVIDHIRSTLGAGLIFITREDMALGWKGFAPGLDEGVVEALALPLSTPSALRLAYQRAAPFRGAPPAEGATLHHRLFKLLRAAVPEEIVVVPIAIKARVVNLVYAHAVGGEVLPQSSVADLMAVCAAAGTAFTRLIQSAKAR